MCAAAFLPPLAAGIFRNLFAPGVLLAAGFLGFSTELAASDITFYTVTKGQTYLQTNSNPPSLKAGSASLFVAQATCNAAFTVYSASIGLPAFGSRPLFSMGNLTLLSFQDHAATPAALDSTYGNGTYTFSFQTVHDGSKVLPLTLSGNAYPNVPQLNNFTVDQTIDTSAPFQLAWIPFTGGTTNDIIQVRIENTGGQVFGTAIRPGATNLLDGTAIVVTIPAHTLAAGRSYLGHLLFEKVTATNLSYSGAPGLAGYWRQTDFYLVTSGVGDTTPPTIISLIPTNGATGVPVDAPLTVTFSKPMGSGFSMSVGGTTNNFNGTWSADRRTCTVSSTNHWPANTTLNWLFNPSSGSPIMGDSSGNPLMSDLATSFTTGTRVLAGSTPLPPTLLNPGPPTNGVFHLLLSGELYRTYVCQSSSDLVNWTSFATNRAGSSVIEFFDPVPPQIGQRFYRMFTVP